MSRIKDLENSVSQLRKELYQVNDKLDKKINQKVEPEKEIYTPWEKRESLNVAIGDYLSNEDIIVIHGGKFVYSDNVMDFNFAIYYKKRDMIYLAGEEHIYSSNLNLFLAPIEDVLLMDYKLALKGLFYDKTKLKITYMGAEKPKCTNCKKAGNPCFCYFHADNSKCYKPK